MNDKETVKSYEWVKYWGSSYFTQINLFVIEIDARVLLAFFPLGVFMNKYMLWFCMVNLGFFVLLGYLGFSVPAALKLARRFFAGSRRSISTNKRRRRRLSNG